ncbi:MAG: hypothetical protein ACW98K_02280 [Candidatus Kariarchaeaceae archaeon]
MSTVVASLGELEEELELLESILQNIFIYDMKKNKLAVNLRFKLSNDFDDTLIGGLTATINEFAGKSESKSIRSIVLKQLKLLFVSEEDFLFVFAVDPSYGDSQFKHAIHLFIDSFHFCYDPQDEGFSKTDSMAISIQIIATWIGETIEFDLRYGDAVELLENKVREIAEQRASDLIGDKFTAVLEEVGSMQDQDMLAKQEGVQKLLDRFNSTFHDVEEITLMRFDDSGFEKTSSGKLHPEVALNVYNTVSGMMNNIITLLNGAPELRTLDLDDKWLYLHYVNEVAFLYVIVNKHDTLELINPTLDRMVSTITSLFPGIIQS